MVDLVELHKAHVGPYVSIGLHMYIIIQIKQT